MNQGGIGSARGGVLPRTVSKRAVVLGIVMAVGVGFLLAFAVPHIAPDARRYALYASRRGWLLLHIGSGAVALLVGPVQLWLGLGRRHLGLHRRLGVALPRQRRRGIRCQRSTWLFTQISGGSSAWG